MEESSRVPIEKITIGEKSGESLDRTIHLSHLLGYCTSMSRLGVTAERTAIEREWFSRLYEEEKQEESYTRP